MLIKSRYSDVQVSPKAHIFQRLSMTTWLIEISTKVLY